MNRKLINWLGLTGVVALLSYTLAVGISPSAFPGYNWMEQAVSDLSAESALYCRIFVEGLFGLDPAGFGKFDVKPHLPSGWNTMRLRHVRAFGKMFSITVSKNGTQITEEE